ncbi:ANTAR domain-containing protein [Frigoribacterium sp. PhB24]|nr:ANTAR domain-containing protein [Frigoribacterium sp. PhB24]
MRAAVAALARATAPGGDLCRPFLDAFGVSGAAMSTLGGPLGTGAVCASDRLSARRDEIQFDLGEGPCWQAHSTNRAVVESDLATAPPAAWPAAAAALSEAGVTSVAAFPLSYGRLDLGAVDLYSDERRELTDDEVDQASTLACIAGRAVLTRALDALEAGDDSLFPTTFSREVHQASGIVMVQLGVGVDEALLVIRGHAWSSGRPLREIASEIVLRRLDFS